MATVRTRAVFQSLAAARNGESNPLTNQEFLDLLESLFFTGDDPTFDDLTVDALTAASGTFSGTLGVTGVLSALGGLELGHASDTTITRTAAGKAAVEGKAIPLMDGAFDVVFAGPTEARTYTLPDASATLFGNSGTLALSEAQNFTFGTTTGTKFGTAATQKLGFYNATPIVQPTNVVDAATDFTGADTVDKALLNALGVKFNQVLSRLEAIGLFAA